MNKPATVFPLGYETLAWIRQGGKPTRSSLHRRFLYSWQSFWFERNLGLQCRLPPVEKKTLAPVFILGLWRSGTTYLHGLLSTYPTLIYPATWQCMGPATCRLRSPPTQSKTIKRPMDKFTIDAFSPQEDEFALLALGVPSVYRAFFDPRRLSEVARWLDPDVWTNCSNDWIEVWRNFLLNVADGKTGRLLLKSPNHTFRIGALLKAFPDASYIWVVRDPEEVLFSNRKMWISMFDEYALWDWQMPKLDAFLHQAFCHAGECLKHATHALPKNRLIVISFDDLIQTPLKTVEAINHRLSLGDWSQTKGLIEAAAGKVDYRKDLYYADDTIQEVKEAMRHLRKIQQYALISHGA